MHLLLVRDDMTRFQHIHPEFVHSSWTVKTTIPDQGVYQMYVDIAPFEEKAHVLRVPITIGGETKIRKYQNRMRIGQHKMGILSQAHDRSTTENEGNKTVGIRHYAKGQPVTNLKPYLGAYGHVVELRHNDADDFFHVHPSRRSNQRWQGRFEGTFPTKGRYTLYSAIQYRGRHKNISDYTRY